MTKLSGISLLGRSGARRAEEPEGQTDHEDEEHPVEGGQGEQEAASARQEQAQQGQAQRAQTQPHNGELAASAEGERGRIAAILGCEEAKGRDALARHLALNTGMGAEEAKAVLAASPKDGGLSARMDADPPRKVGPGEGEPQKDDARAGLSAAIDEVNTKLKGRAA